MNTEHTQSRCLSVAVNDTEGGYECLDEVAFEIEEQDLSSYQRAADFYQQRGHRQAKLTVSISKSSPRRTKSKSTSSSSSSTIAFVELENLKEFIGAAGLYITPYLHEAQITSGTLARAFGAGKAVVSTPYWHAAELLAEEA